VIAGRDRDPGEEDVDLDWIDDLAIDGHAQLRRQLLRRRQQRFRRRGDVDDLLVIEVTAQRHDGVGCLGRQRPRIGDDRLVGEVDVLRGQQLIRRHPPHARHGVKPRHLGDVVEDAAVV